MQKARKKFNSELSLTKPLLNTQSVCCQQCCLSKLLMSHSLVSPSFVAPPGCVSGQYGPVAADTVLYSTPGRFPALAPPIISTQIRVYYGQQGVHVQYRFIWILTTSTQDELVTSSKYSVLPVTNYALWFSSCTFIVQNNKANLINQCRINLSPRPGIFTGVGDVTNGGLHPQMPDNTPENTNSKISKMLYKLLYIASIGHDFQDTLNVG